MYIFFFVYLRSFDGCFCVYYLGAEVLLIAAEIKSKLCFVNSGFRFRFPWTGNACWGGGVRGERVCCTSICNCSNGFNCVEMSFRSLSFQKFCDLVD